MIGCGMVPGSSASAIETKGPFPFVTRRRSRSPDGTISTWESRWRRKHENLLDTHGGSTWWAPGAVAWWIGVLFMVGSLCFAVAALPLFVDAVGTDAANTTFFVGSLFFTSAALLQYLEVVNTQGFGESRPHGRVRVFAFAPGRIDWWASLVQLVGTVFFNVSTWHALDSSLGAAQVNQEVWRPDALGSICFLVASGLAWAEAGHGWVSWRPRDLSWRIAALNVVGSIAFGVSAVAAKVVDGAPRNTRLENLGTLVGAVAFLVGAALLLPERTHPDPSRSDRDGGGYRSA
jgi:hypothetical protein